MLKQRLAWLLVGAIGLATSPATLSAPESNETKAASANPLTVGTGDRYKTSVSYETKGELKAEDVRQVSVLGSRVLAHVHNAERFLAEEKPDQARPELEHAQTLAIAIREMLPVTVVTTTTTDAQGKEIYRYDDRIQDDQIPIVEGMINVQVVQPIIEARKEDAAVKGLQLADADVVHTAMTLNLEYVESKIRQALARLQEPDKARADLLAASAIGVRFTTRKEDHPLVDIQAALRLAEQQVREGKYDGARANLQLARVRLDAYRTVMGDAAGKDARDLEKEIGVLQEKTREPGAADKIRGFWNRVTGWFKPEPGTPRESIAQREATRDVAKNKPQ